MINQITMEYIILGLALTAITILMALRILPNDVGIPLLSSIITYVIGLSHGTTVSSNLVTMGPLGQEVNGSQGEKSNSGN